MFVEYIFKECLIYHVLKSLCVTWESERHSAWIPYETVLFEGLISNGSLIKSLFFFKYLRVLARKHTWEKYVVEDKSCLHLILSFEFYILQNKTQRLQKLINTHTFFQQNGRDYRLYLSFCGGFILSAESLNHCRVMHFSILSIKKDW